MTAHAPCCWGSKDLITLSRQATSALQSGHTPQHPRYSRAIVSDFTAKFDVQTCDLRGVAKIQTKTDNEPPNCPRSDHFPEHYSPLLKIRVSSSHCHQIPRRTILSGHSRPRLLVVVHTDRGKPRSPARQARVIETATKPVEPHARKVAGCSSIRVSTIQAASGNFSDEFRRFVNISMRLACVVFS